MTAAAITNQINAIIASVLSSSPSVAPPPILKPDALKGVDDLIHAGFEAYRATCFNWLLAATGLVIIGLICEGPELSHEITSIVRHWRFTHRFHFSLPEEHAPEWAKLLAFIGWLLIVIGVAGEYVADSFVSKADGYVQTFDEVLLTEAQRGTAFARERASAAYERASENEKETADTLKQAERERADAANSLAAAQTARKQAEGFSLQIAQANERASKAEEQASKDALELARLKTPRSLIRVPELIASLEPFKGTKYVFASVFQDEESIYLLRAIDDALQKAGWERDKSAAGFPAINIYGSEPRNFSVPVGFDIGVKISTDSPKPLDLSMPIKSFPLYIQAAGSLNLALSQCIFPLQTDSVGKAAGVDTGTSTTVRIAVGRKP
jgi:hypothetical protein